MKEPNRGHPTRPADPHGAGRGGGERRGRLFTRNFTLLILGQVSSLTGNFTLKFALSMYVLERTGSATLFASLLAAAMVPTIVLSPFGGLMADRVDRRRLMVALDVLSGLAVLLAALALPLGGELLRIGALLVVLAVLSALESPTVLACVPQMLAGEQLMRGNAAVNQVQAVATLLTPFLGSAVYAAFGLAPVMWGAAACFLLTAALERHIRLPGPPPGRVQSIRAAVREDAARSLYFLRREQPGIWKLLLLAALASMFMVGTAVVGLPYLVRTVLGLPAGYYGAAESAMGATSILGALMVGLLAGRLRLRHLAGVLAGCGLCLIPAGAAFALPLGSGGRYGVLLAMSCLCQLGCSVFSTCAMTAIQQRTPQHLMGKVMAMVYTLSLCAQPAAQLVYGLLFDRLAQAPEWVLMPSGLALCAVAAASARFLAGLERADTALTSAGSRSSNR